ncbi:uncharacterized protein A4U43_C01F31620 [Asparagus officinalis]|uniref:Uncharacterized protein n=1 Tax=Asparagus officinalis TaxID=4686 RepID=A0A5P1FUK6_ASPOF|nr:uncharacterized protein A4U43_C01F31620 [Asparagus officinalis]
MHKSHIGLGSLSTVVASCHQLPMDSGSGFGKVVLGVISSAVRELTLAKGSMVVVSSPSVDGSWIVNVVLWPQVILALQLDPTCALKPVTGKYLKCLVGDGGDQVVPSRMRCMNRMLLDK